MKYKGMVITDLDGTLLKNNQIICKNDLDTLNKLEQNNICRVIATGRSLYSFQKVIPENFPIDFVIFSSGAGTIKWNNKELIHSQNLIKEQIYTGIDVLNNNRLDFMVHFPVPENHKFYYVNHNNLPDFIHRLQIYNPYIHEMNGNNISISESCQLLAISNNPKDYDIIKEKLPDFKVIRTTSPLNHKSTWIEIFHPNVSKGKATKWLCKYLSIPIEKTMGIGNDYNDIDLLLETNKSFVVSNAPIELKESFTCIESNENNGFTKAVIATFKLS